MAGGYIGRSDGIRREVVDMHIGTSAGRKQVLAAYVGTASGNKQWYTRTPDLAFTYASVDQATPPVIGLNWTILGPSSKFTYNLYRNGSIIASTTNAGYQDTGLGYSVTYTYRVDAIRNGIVADTATVAVATPAAPPPPPPSEVPFNTGELRAWTSQTYQQNGTPGSFVANMVYVGYAQTGTRGIQKSTWNFSIPGYVRNCKRIDRVYMRVRINHTYNSDYGDFGVVVHHNGGQDWRSTGIFAVIRGIGAHEGTQGDSWLGEGYYGKYGDGYLDVTNYTVPGSFGGRNWTVAEEIRAGGAQGLGFMAPSNGSHNYGYGWGVNSTADPYWWPSLIIQGIL